MEAALEIQNDHLNENPYVGVVARKCRNLKKK